jgi:hypothetical protein
MVRGLPIFNDCHNQLPRVNTLRVYPYQPFKIHLKRIHVGLN